MVLFKMVMEEVCALKPYEIALEPERILSDKEVVLLTEIKDRLRREEPIQYIFGYSWFNGMKFKVDKHTLIPRQETEELIAWIAEDLREPEIKILDIGTGTGCIAISLAKTFPKSSVYAIDVSQGALRVAGKNAEAHEVEVRFVHCDILAQRSLDDLYVEELPLQFDVIVSNPPYVRDLERSEIKRNVLEHEPEGALFVSDRDPLLFYRKITELASKNLLPGGRLFFEINQYLGPETKALVESFGFSEVGIRSDLSGNHRMIKAIK